MNAVGRGVVVDAADMLELLNYLNLVAVGIGVGVGGVNEVGNRGSVYRLLAPFLIDNGTKEGEEEQKYYHKKSHDRKLGSEESTQYESYGTHLKIGLLLVSRNGGSSGNFLFGYEFFFLFLHLLTSLSKLDTGVND